MSERHSGTTRLDSWKEIAAYLGRDVRTVIRWEKTRGLPVRRLPGGQAVFAYQDELDAWLEQAETPTQAAITEIERAPERARPGEQPLISPKKGRRWWYFVSLGFAMSVLVAVVAGRMLLSPTVHHRQFPTQITFTVNSIQAFDEQNHLLWTHTFSKNFQLDYLNPTDALSHLVRIVDFNDDGEREVLVTVPLHSGPNPTDLVFTEIDCFSSQGKLLWSYSPQERFHFGDHELDGPWSVFDIFITPGPKPAIWATLSHYRWGNSFVVQIDPKTGKDAVRFVNTGTIYTLNEARISGKTYLLAGGFNNEYAAGILAVLDEAQPFAVSPQTPGTRHKCTSCPEGVPERYFVFPRSEINLQRHLWEDSVRGIDVLANRIEIRKAELSSPELGSETSAAATLYVFRIEPVIKPISLRFDSTYDILHRKLEKEHKLDHSLEACPERRHPMPVREWTPSTAWMQANLNPVRAVD